MSERDIVERLREPVAHSADAAFEGRFRVSPLHAEAADEIERLRSAPVETEALRGALEMVEAHPWTPVSVVTRIRQIIGANYGALESYVGLHEGIEITYTVDQYEATLTTHDGASTKATGAGVTIMDALVDLRRALSQHVGGEG